VLIELVVFDDTMLPWKQNKKHGQKMKIDKKKGPAEKPLA
jgi:hypothetical protein